MSTAKTSFPFNVGNCPACKKAMIGQASAELDTSNLSYDLQDDGSQSAKVGVVLTGFSVTHNCIPVVTR